jgi:hypothetical protein
MVAGDRVAHGESGAGEKARVLRGFRQAAQAEMAGPSGVGARGPEKVIRARAMDESGRARRFGQLKSRKSAAGVGE